LLLLYFNGFNSGIPEDWSDNQKISGVEEFASRQGFRFMPCTVDYRHACRRSAEILAQLDEELPGDDGPVILAGASLGGWFARVLQVMLAQRRPALATEVLAFNPAFDLGLHGHVLLGPQVNTVTQERYEWAPEDSQRLGGLERSVDYDAPLPFFVYVDKGDEVIDWRASASRHAGIARFRAFEGGSHLFEHVREALDDFASARSAPGD
jgi:predicted esterase YcpF (UPF0227 family)